MIERLGDKIRRLRKEKRLTLEGLAAATGSSKSYIWELENRDSAPRPSAEKLFKIADVLGTTVELLLDESGKLNEEDAVDAHFYRKYREMQPETKARIRRMIDLWDDDA
ncbi:XRE family transcriptional regulator [Labrenzia sp. CP4]|uniref:helix-turn-helix domain-containing protein n=1 Tax=Labrenzia sp. CP4 TaxID=1674922 RepID=UPI000784EE2B|nr:helix-turn-helix transcriptional regulator [Labrenzia sp. CP4]AMN55329.1 XRE family transcriptional regulator [Labrenzia sp. CP4]